MHGVMSAVTLSIAVTATAANTPNYQAELVFPLRQDHNHAPGLVVCPNGDLLASWYRGSGERSADDVAVYGARKRRGGAGWSKPFVMADTPGFPDCNTCMVIDQSQHLWLFWPVIIANSWESCLTHYRVARDYQRAGAPAWQRQGIILLKPIDFGPNAKKMLDRLLEQFGSALDENQRAEVAELRARLGDKLYQRLGWQPRCKPTILPNGRMLLPLYSDTYSISIMALSDDQGASWSASAPLIGFGNIQPSVLRRNDGTLVAYMRENGPRRRVRIATSSDDGSTWGAVTETDFPNPGSGLDAVRLHNGHRLIVYNDSERDRRSLAVSLSNDEGRTWPWQRHLEQHATGAYHYPCVTQAPDGTVHVIYSYFVDAGKSMKHVAINEVWVRAGD